jgi:hypothetical protein
MRRVNSSAIIKKPGYTLESQWKTLCYSGVRQCAVPCGCPTVTASALPVETCVDSHVRSDAEYKHPQ